MAEGKDRVGQMTDAAYDLMDVLRHEGVDHARMSFQLEVGDKSIDLGYVHVGTGEKDQLQIELKPDARDTLSMFAYYQLANMFFLTVYTQFETYVNAVKKQLDGEEDA